MTIKVVNRSIGNTCYTLPELNIRRVFTVGEVKEIDEKGRILLYYADDSEFQAVAEMNGGELFIEEGTDAMHYKKVDKFTEFDWDSFTDAGEGV